MIFLKSFHNYRFSLNIKEVTLILFTLNTDRKTEKLDCIANKK